MTSAALDPLIQLAVGIAVSPGGYAVLLGSGVSMEAGIPTGEQVLSNTKGRLYRIKNEVDPPGPQELEQWLIDEGFEGLGYSDLLETVLPTTQGRRDYLTGFFEGKSPGPTHLVLAELAAEGLVRIFITTNFDPLLEQAMQAKGVACVMVSDSASLESAPARETVDCFVVKAHGDAGQLNVRNTLAEIETLEPRMQEELEEICARHGVLTLGYSGNDHAVAKALRRTSPRFGLFWGSRREDLPAAAKAIVDAAQGKVVVRPGAHELVKELGRRVGSWREHPSGETPTTVRAEMIERLRAKDEVGVAELAKAERRHFEEQALELIYTAYEELGPIAPSPEQLKNLEADLAALLERKIATGFALIEHHREGFVAEVEWLAEFSARELGLPDGSYTAWSQAPRRLAWSLVWIYAAFACASRRFYALRVLWKAQEPTVEATPLAAMQQGGGREFGEWLELARGKRMAGDGIWYLAYFLTRSEMVSGHYAELLRSLRGDNVQGVLDSFGDASYFFAALGGRDGVPIPEYWRVQGVDLHLALLMERDRRLQMQLLDLFEPEPGTEEEIAEWIIRWRKENRGKVPG